MATTGVLTVVETSVGAGQPVRFKLVLTNGGGTAVNVSRVSTFTSPAGAAATVSTPQMLPTTPTAIAESGGTLTMFFDAMVFANVRPNQACTTVSFGCNVLIDDASIVSPSLVAITAVPQTEPQIYIPKIGVGSLRFDSQNQSANYPVLL